LSQFPQLATDLFAAAALIWVCGVLVIVGLDNIRALQRRLHRPHPFPARRKR